MGKKIKIRTSQPWIAYPGSAIQQNYAEELTHGYLEWNITNRDKFNVNFCRLPNPQPFVTLEWRGNVADTFADATKYPQGARIRVKSAVHVSQQEIQNLTSLLKNQVKASEVMFKIDQNIDRETLSTGTQTLARADLRNFQVLLKLIKDFHVSSALSDDTWQRVEEKVKEYLSIVTQQEDSTRNTKWILRDIKFDNTFAYGESNHINFDNLNGIVGIFGPNRAGKSSIVGTILYNLFNATDRGSIKNMYVCNVRKPFCYTRAVIDVNGVNYVIERQTTKHENRRGVQNAATALNVFRIDESGDAADLAGEQRLDTEKIIRGLIGNVDDFLLTSLSAQDDVSAFIKQGTTKRRQILSRFLDLDIFDKMYALANDDLKSVKSQLKIIPDKDWNDIVGSYKKNLQQIQADDESCTQRLRDANEQLNDARLELTKHGDQALVTQTQVDSQKKRVEQLEQQATKLTSDISTLNGDIERISAKLLTIEEIKKDNDVVSLKQRLDILSTLESSVTNLRLILDKECAILKQQERSTKILDDVPCGDSFPKCKFIKDAYLIRQKIDSQRSRVSKAQEKFDAASIELNNANIVDIRSKLDKLQQLHDRFAKLQLDASNKRTAIVKLESQRDLIVSQLEPAKAKLEVLEEALKNDENVEVVSLRSKIDNCLGAISRLDSDRLRLASERGKIISDIEKVHQEKRSREQLLQKMQVFELIAMAFSKKGIPSVIVGSQLPVINGEIAKILAGIVNFTIELEADEESDSMDVFINYGDSRRIIELASGMEKLISSMAIRVALINVSTLPKTNMLIIDEGFGALDDAGIESCNRLLVSLKRYFRTLLIITHVDAVKDVADQIIEVTKDEKDAHVSVE